MNLTILINPKSPDDCTGCDHLTSISLGGAFHPACMLFGFSRSPLCSDGPGGHAFPCLECVYHRDPVERALARLALIAHGFSLAVENYERTHPEVLR